MEWEREISTDIRNASIATTSCLWMWWLECTECLQDLRVPWSNPSRVVGKCLVHWPPSDVLCCFCMLGRCTGADCSGKSCFALTHAGMHSLMCSGSLLLVGNWTWHASMFCACILLYDPQKKLSGEPLVHRYGNGTRRCLGWTNRLCSIEDHPRWRGWCWCRNFDSPTSTSTIADEPLAPPILSRFCRKMFQGWPGYHH